MVVNVNLQKDLSFLGQGKIGVDSIKLLTFCFYMFCA